MRFHRFLAVLLVLPFLLLGCGKEPASEAPADVPDAASEKMDNVRVTSPAGGSTITSPVTITGEARGTWFFEASFPVRIVDDQGQQVGIGVAQAEGEWMTTDFVPFSATVEYSTNATQGALLLKKDNPSGEPQYDAQIAIPVQFGS
jgi:hypothetical protein